MRLSRKARPVAIVCGRVSRSSRLGSLRVTALATPVIAPTTTFATLTALLPACFTAWFTAWFTARFAALAAAVVACFDASRRFGRCEVGQRLLVRNIAAHCRNLAACCASHCRAIGRCEILLGRIARHPVTALAAFAAFASFPPRALTPAAT